MLRASLVGRISRAEILAWKAETAVNIYLTETKMDGSRFGYVHNFAVRRHNKDETIQRLRKQNESSQNESMNYFLLFFEHDGSPSAPPPAPPPGPPPGPPPRHPSLFLSHSKSILF